MIQWCIHTIIYLFPIALIIKFVIVPIAFIVLGSNIPLYTTTSIIMNFSVRISRIIFDEYNLAKQTLKYYAKLNIFIINFVHLKIF